MSQKDNSQIWLIPFADLMSVLVILFLALYGYSVNTKRSDYEMAMALMQKELGAADADKKIKDMGLTKKVEEDLKKQIQDGQLGVEVTTSRIKLTFASPVLFDSGSATLKEGAKDLLKSVAENLKTMDNPVLVEGHTDAARMLGHKFRSNRELSLMRAFSVIDYLIFRGLAPEKLTACGYGEFRPVGPNTTEEERAKNRRIEIIVMREEGRES
ncbi:MAG: OmpA family protein [Elusimicrobia bacterium]|nr:OmpA family protein [Elusimicrobiota bacterium]